MTSPASQVPRPLPPPKRSSLRQWLLAPAVLAAAGLVALAVWRLGFREAPPGPLDADLGEWVGIGRPAGSEWGYGFAVVYNQGDQPVVLERISLLDATPGLEVVGTGIAGPDRKYGSLATWIEMPADLGRGMAGQLERRGLLENVDLDLDRGQHLGEADALLQRLRHLLMVEGVARRVNQPAAIGDRDPAPPPRSAWQSGPPCPPSRQPRARRAAPGRG